MSDGSGSGGPPFVVGWILALSLLGLGLYNHQHEGGARYATPQYEEGKTPIFSAVPAPPSDLEPNRKEWREETDLNAQRDMAKWAFLMFITSIAGVVVGGFGLVLIRETLLATHKASDYTAQTLAQAKLATDAAHDATFQTRRIGNEQLQARLALVDLDFKFSERSVGGQIETAIGLTITVVNSGILPATDVVGGIHILQEVDAGEAIHLLTEPVFSFDIPKGEPKHVVKLSADMPGLSRHFKYIVCGEIQYHLGLIDGDRTGNFAHQWRFLNINYGVEWDDGINDYAYTRIAKKYYPDGS